MWENKLFCSQCLEEELLKSCSLSLYRADLIHLHPLHSVLEVFRVEKMFDHTLCSPARAAQGQKVLFWALHCTGSQGLNPKSG